MEGNSTNSLRSYKNDLDNICKSVMPDSWEGHARLAIRESEDVPESIEDKAIEKANRLADEKGVAPERVANKIIGHIAENRKH
jgi:hypothetical protein